MKVHFIEVRDKFGQIVISSEEVTPHKLETYKKNILLGKPSCIKYHNAYKQGCYILFLDEKGGILGALRGEHKTYYVRGLDLSIQNIDYVTTQLIQAIASEINTNGKAFVFATTKQKEQLGVLVLHHLAPLLGYNPYIDTLPKGMYIECIDVYHPPY